MAAKSSQKHAKPLYRKVNTRARGVHHQYGGDYRDNRSTLRADSTKMSRGKRRGLDYTPLYNFLLKSIGRNWDDIYSDVVARVEDREAIFHIVARNELEIKPYVCVNEASYYSGLHIDEHGILQITAPDLNESSLEPSCACCTHTFNGIPFVKKYTVYSVNGEC